MFFVLVLAFKGVNIIIYLLYTVPVVLKKKKDNGNIVTISKTTECSFFYGFFFFVLKKYNTQMMCSKKYCFLKLLELISISVVLCHLFAIQLGMTVFFKYFFLDNFSRLLFSILKLSVIYFQRSLVLMRLFVCLAHLYVLSI